jgi:hypothetical protein
MEVSLIFSRHLATGDLEAAGVLTLEVNVGSNHSDLGINLEQADKAGRGVAKGILPPEDG